MLTYLNWQKMSAYSAEILDACSTVTLKVKLLPIFRCESACSCMASPTPSTPSFWGLPGASGVTERQKTPQSEGSSESNRRQNNMRKEYYFQRDFGSNKEHCLLLSHWQRVWWKHSITTCHARVFVPFGADIKHLTKVSVTK